MQVKLAGAENPLCLFTSKNEIIGICLPRYCKTDSTFVEFAF